MKKRIFILILVILCLTIVGCKNNNEEEKLEGGWIIESTIKNANMPEDALNAFNDAKKLYSKSELEPIALLGTQVVAGTNYMFLASSTSEKAQKELKVVVVYKDLDKKSEITKVNDFDIDKYVSDGSTSEGIVGGWTVNNSDPKVVLEDEVQYAFEDALKTFDGATYKPIALLGTQVVAGTNYAVLCLETTVTKEPVYTISVLTIYKNLDGVSVITNISRLDLSKFNN